MMLRQICKIGQSCGCGFRNTGAKFGHVWEAINKIIKKEVWCEECQIHGLQLISFLRDLVSVGIGRAPHDPRNFEKIYHEIVCVYEKYQKRKDQFGGFK